SPPHPARRSPWHRSFRPRSFGSGDERSGSVRLPQEIQVLAKSLKEFRPSILGVDLERDVRVVQNSNVRQESVLEFRSCSLTDFIMTRLRGYPASCCCRANAK